MSPRKAEVWCALVGALGRLAVDHVLGRLGYIVSRNNWTKESEGGIINVLQT